MPRSAHAVAVLAVVVVAAVAGCGDRVDDVAGGPGLSTEETAWAERYVRWRETLTDALADEESARFEAFGDAARYRAAVGPLLACRSSLDEQLGDAPTARTDGIRLRLRDACAPMERKVGALADAFDGAGDPVQGMVAAAEGIGSVGQELSEVDDAIERYSLSRRVLQRAPWPERGSRLDPVLARAAASTTEGFEADVRCWSRDEWPRVIDEEEVLSGGEITLDSTGAFANPTTRQIHMQAPDCDALGRARAERRWWPADEDDRYDLAWALAVLAHEAQHIAGVWDEAETECRGQQRLADVAVALGAPLSRARALAELSWRDQYPELDEDYVTALCRDGGPYDLRPGRADGWPWS
jgi:hypothetical protein